jgi:hypothetical protein
MRLVASSPQLRVGSLVPARWRAASAADRARWAETAFFVGALLLGAFLRFVWLPDMEYKGDERWTFDRTQRIPGVDPWPALGMPSSVGLLNPGLSLWVFVVLAGVFRAHDPVALARAVVTCNLAAFALLFVFTQRAFQGLERRAWHWGLALAAVSPTAIALERKIWPPCAFPLFCAFFLVGWLRRDRRWGGALWGFTGALLGQVQMSGFFYAAGFVLWEAALGRTRIPRRRARWLPWMCGSIVGALPLCPWLLYLRKQHDYAPSHDFGPALALRAFRNWFSDTLGLGLDYSLGNEYWAFLRSPLVWTRDLFPTLYLQGLAFALGLYVIGCALAALRRAVRPPRALRTQSETAFTLGAAFFAFGILLNFVVVVVQRQYTEVTFPLEWVGVAYLALKHVAPSRRVLVALWAVQLCLSVAFLAYIHDNHGAPGGDYGVAYRWQHLG